MVASIDPKNATAVSLPDEANATTSVDVKPSEHPYQPARVVNAFCDWAEREAAATSVDLKRMDSDGRSLPARINSGLFGGISMFALKTASATLRSAPIVIAHPIDTAARTIRGIPGPEKMVWELAVKADKDINLLRTGRVAEGVAKISGSGTEVGSYFVGVAGVVKSAASFLKDSAQLVRLGKNEIVAAANAVRVGIEGGGGAMATASGVYMCADAAEATVSAPAVTMSTPGSGLLSGPLLMSAADDTGASGVKPNSKDQPSSGEKQYAFFYSRRIGDEMGLQVNDAGQHIYVDTSGETHALRVGDQIVLVMDDSGVLKRIVVGRNPLGISLDTSARDYASSLHNEWRASRSTVEGTAADWLPKREPRWKKVAADDPSLSKTPEPFKRVADGTTEVDIANLDFDRLPNKYQYENAAAAEGAAHIIENHIGDGGIVVIDVDAASTMVHDQWLDRNGSWAPPEQSVPFHELSGVEQEKDRVVVRTGAQAVHNQVRGDGHFVNVALQEEGRVEELSSTATTANPANAAVRVFTDKGSVKTYLEELIRAAVPAEDYSSHMAYLTTSRDIQWDHVIITSAEGNTLILESGDSVFQLTPSSLEISTKNGLDISHNQYPGFESWPGEVITTRQAYWSVSKLK